ncbi:MAG: multiple antibiotic resistance protein [Desulfuromonadales bacterium]|nr:multiple antibiotic resistance protein [Desulfuromonadales bacterium]
MQASLDLLITFVVQLFILVDPVAGAPVFLAITPHDSAAERRTMALRGCFVAAVVVWFFILAGPWVLGYFGIKTAAVRTCGGILLFAIALEMLYGRTSGTETSPGEERLAEIKKDISITPLAIPLLAGPGTIATALIFAGRASGPLGYLALLLGTAVVFAGSFVILSKAELLTRVLGKLGTTVVTRIMGLVLAFLAVQYVLDGLATALGRG